MNIIEAVKVIIDDKEAIENPAHYIDAVMIASELSAQYDALAPDWNEAPEWAQWYAIDCHNAGYWFDAPKPLISYDNETYDAPTWANSSLCKFAVHIGLLPIGIDWRICKWRRPKVAG